MKKKKFTLFIIVLLSLSIFISGCSGKVSEKVAEKIVEKGLEKALGDENNKVDINTKDNSLSISNKDGGMEFGEDLDWPSDKMAPLPKPKAKLVGVIEQANDNTMSVSLQFPNLKDALAYMEEIKKQGFVEESTLISEGFYSFQGFSKDMIQINLQIAGDEEYSITNIYLIRDSDSARTFFERLEEVQFEPDFSDEDMTDDYAWPEDKMDNIPRFKGKIIGAGSVDNSRFIQFEFITKDDVLSYIEELKALGFNLGIALSLSRNEVYFMASNDQEDMVTVEWQKYRSSLVYTKHK